MKSLKIAVLAGVVMLSAPAFAQDDLTTTLTNMVVEQSTKAMEQIQSQLSDELSKKFDEAMAAMMPQSAPEDASDAKAQSPAKEGQ